MIVCPTGVIGPYDFRGSMMGDVIQEAADANLLCTWTAPMILWMCAMWRMA